MIATQAARYDERSWCGKETSVLEVAVMIEGQDGITWRRWRRLARATEDLGFSGSGLYRSDHFTNPTSPYLDALELWASLTRLARFACLVPPPSHYRLDGGCCRRAVRRPALWR